MPVPVHPTAAVGGRRLRRLLAATILLCSAAQAEPALRLKWAVELAGPAEATPAEAAVDGPVRLRPLSLRQALERAGNGTPALAQGAAAIDKAEAGLLGAVGAFLPTADLSAQLAHYGNENQQATLIGSSVVQSETAFYGSYAALSASLNLYAGGRSQAGYRAAQAELGAARADYENLRVGQMNQALEQYVALAKADQEYRSLRQRERLHAAQVEFIARAHQEGRASRLDLGAARLQHGERQQQVYRQLANLEGRAGQLAVGLGMELAGDERLSAPDSLPAPPELPAGWPDTAGHPALLAAELRLETARNKVAGARGGFLPKVDLVGSYSWVGRDSASAGAAIEAIQANSYTVGLTVQQRLAPFTGESAALQAAQAELRAAEARLQEVRLGLANAQRQALAAVAQAQATLAIASQAEQDADEALFLQQARLRHGRGDQGALLEAREQAAQRRLERQFQDLNHRLTGWAAYALLDPQGYPDRLLGSLP